jgi:hypothetical protein
MGCQNAHREGEAVKKQRGVAIIVFWAIASACGTQPRGIETDPAVLSQRAPAKSFDDRIEDHARSMFEDGRKVFRYDTFGSEEFWGGRLRLHQAILGEKLSGLGPGVTARQALQLGLKVDIAALPQILVEVLRTRAVDLDKVETSLELLRANAVVGVTGFFDKQTKAMTGIGIQCALCHSTVDDSFAKGIGRRLDGWPNRDLDIGAIVASAPTLKPFAELLGTDEGQVRKVLLSWGPGRYDAELNHDGKALRPDGKKAATVLPAAFGLAGVNLHTYSGWGSVAYWNAYVANTQMYGKGTFFDPRLNNAEQFPLAAKSGFWNKRDSPDLITSKLASLHYYQLSLPAPEPPSGSYNIEAAARGKAVFQGKARCAICHVPPLFTEPGWSMHAASEIGIDDFQSSRSPDKKFYRTTPLKGLFTRAKGGFYHDGRFPDLAAVVAHYRRVLKIDLSDAEAADLLEYLKSL